MAYTRTRQKLGLGPEVPDEEVLRRGYAAAQAKRPGMDSTEYRTRLDQYEGAGAPAAPQGRPVAPPAAVPEGNRAAPAFNPMGALQGAGRFVGEAARGMVSDAAAVPRSIGDSFNQLGRIGQSMAQGKLDPGPTPEETGRSRQAGAFMAGNAAGGIAGLLGKKAVAGVGSRGLRMMMEGGIGGSAGGGVDAALRTGDLRQAPGGAVVGGALGGLLGGAASRIRKAPPAPPRTSGEAFARAYPEVFADVTSGKLEPGEAIYKALGPGTIVEDGSMNQLRRELTEHVASLTKPASGKARNPLRSVGGRLAESGPEGESILARVKEADTVALTEAGPVKRRLRDAGLPRLKHEEDRALGHALRGSDVPLTPRAEAVRGEARGYLGGVVPRAQQAGLPTGNLGETYFPQNTPDVAHMRRGGAMSQGIASLRRMMGDRNASANPMRDDILDNIQHLKAAGDPAGAEALLDDYIGFIESGGREGGDAFAKLGGGDPAQAKAQALRHYQESRVERNPNLDYRRESSLPFYDPSPSRVLPRYVENAERRIAEATQYGPKGEKITGLLDKIGDPEARSRTTGLAKSATGMVEEPDSDLTKWVERGRRYSATRLSTASTVLNLSQNINSLYASDAGSFVKGVARAATKSGENLSIDSGAISETALANVKHAIRPGSDFVDKYLKFIGFSGVEKLNRRIAANVGFVYAQKMAKRLKSRPGDAFARKELAALELDVEKIARAGGLDEKDLIRAAKVFVDRTQFRQREIDLPSMFSSSAIGRNVTQFKGFSYQQGQFLSREILDQWRSGTPQGQARAARNLAALFAAAPILGEGVGNARAFILAREREKGGLARYLENLGYAGGLGIMLDALQSLEYNPVSYVAGPTAATGAGVASSLWSGGKRAVKKGEGFTPGEKRTLIRALPGGAMVANRAFPPEKKNTGTRPSRPTTRPERKERPR